MSEARNGLGVTELAERLKTAKSTVHRMLSTLEDQGWVKQNDLSSRYELTWKLFEVGSGFVRVKGFDEQIAHILKALADGSRESAKLAVWEKDEIVIVYKVDAGESFRMDLHVGTRLPAHCTALGKALLSAFDTRDIERYLAEQTLARGTRNSIVDAVKLRKELALTRQRGYALDQCEHHDDVACAAAPIRDGMGMPVAAVSISGPAWRLDAGRIEQLVPMVVHAAEQVSSLLGYTTSKG